MSEHIEEAGASSRQSVLEMHGLRADLWNHGSLPSALVVSAADLADHQRAVRELPVISILPASELAPGRGPVDAEQWVDLVVPDAEISVVLQAIERNPEACRVVVDLVGATEHLPLDRALSMESMAYSLLQTGSEYKQWAAGRQRTPPDSTPEPQVVVSERHGGFLVELNRTGRANALGLVMRHELVEALAALSAARGPITLTARGPHFCAGGDLGDFGPVADPLHTHRVRTIQALPREVAALAPRLTVHPHGASVGAGVELMAFAGHVVAAEDATFRLPEAAMGLLPGCGGTVSLPRRIGRSRALLMMLTGMTVNVRQALEWGLVDRVQACP